MKTLFLARHFSYLRPFESAVAELAERGHLIHLSADREESLGGAGLVERFAARYPCEREYERGRTGGYLSSAWRKQMARLKGLVRAPIGYAS